MTSLFTVIPTTSPSVHEKLPLYVPSVSISPPISLESPSASTTLVALAPPFAPSPLHQPNLQVYHRRTRQTIGKQMDL